MLYWARYLPLTDTLLANEYSYFHIIFQTPLHIAAILNGDDVIRLLISRGARVDLTDCHGNNIFHLIAMRGNVQALQAVITLNSVPSKQFISEVERGVNARNYMGVSPLFLAVKHRQESILKMLAAFGADVDLPVSEFFKFLTSILICLVIGTP